MISLVYNIKNQMRYVFFVFIAILSANCTNKDKKIEVEDNLSDTLFLEKDSAKEENFSFVFRGTYLDWIATKNDLYFPLTSLDTTINKQREYYNDHYLKIRNYWLILVEVGVCRDILNEFPLIPLLKSEDRKEVKRNLTHIFALPRLREVIIHDYEMLSKEDELYRVTIEIISRDCLNCAATTSCKYILDISYKKGLFYFKTDCNRTKIVSW